MASAFETAHLRLTEAVPEFLSTLDEHVDFHGEVLQHVLFGDLARFVVSAHEAGDKALVQRVLDYLADEVQKGGERVQELVAVSFVENVGPWDEGMQEFISSWPRPLREEARRQREWKAPAK